MLGRIKHNFRNRLLSGVLVLVPFVVTAAIIRWLFQRMAGFLSPVLNKLVPRATSVLGITFTSETHIEIVTSVLSIILLILLVYAVGAITQFVVGKRIISFGERLVLRVPIVRTIYAATKQVMQTLSMPDRTAFKSVVLVDFPRPGLKAIGFLTGYLTDADGKRFCKVFIPTTPNPTTGFLEIVPPEELIETTISVEEAFKTIISGGIVSPEILTSVRLSRSTS